MKFAIDIGNTLIKAGAFEGQELKEVFRFQSESELLDLVKQKTPSNVIVSNVKKDLTFLRDSISAKLLILDHNTPLPIVNGYKTPETLGADRLSGIAGAYAMFPDSNTLVIDLGTCIKCDLINQSNEYLGGSISPGLKMRFNALNHYTSKQPLIDFEEINLLNGKSTKESILSGVINGATFEIEGYINQYEKIFPDLNVIITGGDAYCFESRIKRHIFVVPDLVLLGLHKILLYNLSITSA